MVMAAEGRSKTAACMGNDCGSVSTRFGRNGVEIKERRRLEQPDTNIRVEVETAILLHCAPTTFATETAAAVYKHRATPRK